MSKKDKKRIEELEKTVSNLIRMHVNLRDNYILHSIEQDKLKAFPSGTIPSEKEQSKTEQPDPILNEETRKRCVMAGRNWGKSICFFPSLMEKDFAETEQSQPEKEQGKTEQPQQSEVQKEQELMEELNKELAKFASLEAFNADRKNRFLPPVGKLEFHKMKSAIECTFAIAKMVRPELFDQIDQIKIPKEGQGETEQIEPKFSNESIIPKFPDGAKVHYFGTSGREDFTTLHHIVLRYKDIFDAQLSIKGLTNLELIKQVDKMAVLFRNELHELMQSETNKGKEGRGETKQSQPENHRKNLGEPILNKPQSKEEKRANRINAALKMAVEDLYKHLNFTLQNFGKDRAKQVEMLQSYCDHFKQDLSDFRRKVLSVSELGGVKENEAILPAPEEKEADENTANLGKPDGSELHKSDSKDLGGADVADSPTRAGFIIINCSHSRLRENLGNVLYFESVKDKFISTTKDKKRAKIFKTNADAYEQIQQLLTIRTDDFLIEDLSINACL